MHESRTKNGPSIFSGQSALVFTWIAESCSRFEFANAQVCATQPCPAQRAMWIICATLYDTFVSLTSFRGFSYFKYSTL